MLPVFAALPAVSVVPLPVNLTVGSGTFTLAAKSAIAAPRDLRNEAGYLRDILAPSTGYELPIVSKAGDGAIQLEIDGKLERLGPEGYTLDISPKRIVIRGSKPAGVFYGIQTLRQLFPAAIERRGNVENVAWVAPCVQIEDKPRFSWRGSHMDTARHFMPKEFVLKYIDLMAMNKLNTFHWHLTDDQGWRIEIKKYPKLTEVGAWRKDTMTKYDPPTFTGVPHGGFYTQDDIREVVAYAAARHITVVPEIEMPGHAQAAIAAYPELGNTGEQLEVATRWGVITHVFNPEDRTIEFLKDVLTEVMGLFPSQYIHIGGDECPKDEWKASAYAQAKMAKLGIKTEHELQSWFIRQMDEFLASKGRRLIGWSEILEGGLAPKAALMVWLGDEGAMEAVGSGHDVVMAQTTHTYFDYYQAKDRTKEPHAIGGFLPLEKAYSYEPILPGMTPEQAKHVMGVQYQLWAEYIPNGKHMEYMAFPRGCALAEVAWSPKESRNFEDFQNRLPAFLDRLTVRDVNFRRLDAGYQ